MNNHQEEFTFHHVDLLYISEGPPLPVVSPVVHAGVRSTYMKVIVVEQRRVDLTVVEVEVALKSIDFQSTQYIANDY